MAVIIPQNIDFRTWNGLLQMDWPNATIPTDVNGTDWKQTARIIATDPAFAPFSPPMPDGHAEQLEWIQAFSNAIY